MGPFPEGEARQEVRRLRKIPFDFCYRREYDGPDATAPHLHKIVDWEAGALYWNCLRRHGSAWQAPFREKLEEDLRDKDLMFLMGNQHRFQDPWLIVSLIYPPGQPPGPSEQGALFSPRPWSGAGRRRPNAHAPRRLRRSDESPSIAETSGPDTPHPPSQKRSRQPGVENLRKSSSHEAVHILALRLTAFTPGCRAKPVKFRRYCHSAGSQA